MKKTVVIIGAGPAGLVTLKTLLEHSSPELEFDPVILEAEDDIGGTFRSVVVYVSHSRAITHSPTRADFMNRTF